MQKILGRFLFINHIIEFKLKNVTKLNKQKICPGTFYLLQEIHVTARTH